MTGRPSMRDLPHHRSFATLGKSGQAAIASSLLRGLGFDPKPTEPLEGLSGLTHEVQVIGVDAERRRVVVVQTGAETLARFYHDTVERLPATGPPKITPEQKRLQWLQRSLFTTFDLKATFERAGWSFNSLYFFNSFEVPISGVEELEEREWLMDHGFPRDTTMTSLGGHEPPAELNIGFLRDHVIAAGASFVDAGQLGFKAIGPLAKSANEFDAPLVEEVLSRIRLSQFFRPPLDELLLGTLAKAGPMEPSELARTATVATKTGHDVACNTVVPEAGAANPEETLRRLADLRMVTFKRSEFYLESPGKAVVQQWEKTAEEPLFVKILRELRIPEIVEAVIRGLRGGAG